MRELGGKVAIITGGASGIGLAMAERFGREGMTVVLADLDEPRLREQEARLAEDGIDVAVQWCDTTSAAAVEELVRVTHERFGGVHVFCNNAGVVGAGDAWDGPVGVWERVLSVNVMGVVHGIRAVLPVMQDQGEGHIVNTASMAGLIAMPGAAPYNASKHAVVAISEALYLELQGTGSPVGVSVLCPGFVRTRLLEHEHERDAAPASVFGALILDLVRAGVETGIEPAEVADQVLDAIVAERFWILTHPDMRELPVERMRRAATQENPALDAP